MHRNRRGTYRDFRRAFGLLAMLHAPLAPMADARAQQDSPTEVWGEVFVGSEPEHYLRLLQVVGGAAAYPWSIRGFGVSEVEDLLDSGSDHPWATRYDYEGADSRFSPVRPEIQAIFNSGFPYGSNDGVVWAGRGLTSALQAGVAARLGPLSVVLAPTLFRSENGDFDLRPNGEGNGDFRDARYPTQIDLPQRFGDGPFGRLDPGQSTLRVDQSGLTLGASTANQHWGPARSYPIILGPNAAGFAHLFLGTVKPVDLRVGRLHARLVSGRLEQSAFSPMPSSNGRRLMSGLVAVFLPAGMPGLELGGSRFFHIPWPGDGVRAEHVLRPFQGLLKSGISDPDQPGENQLGSVFARWTFPASGFEIYGEFAREDHNHDVRDLVLEPDHNSAYLLGFQRVWMRDTSHWLALRAEVVNADVSHLQNVRPQSHFYQHSTGRQGHTHRGQLLGSPAVFGGGGAILAADYYHPGGRFTSFVERVLRQEQVSAGTLDVLYSAGLESLFSRGRFEVTTGLIGAWNLNRDFTGDRFNANARVRVRGRI